MSDIDSRVAVAKLEQRFDNLCRELNEDKAESGKMMSEIFIKLNNILEAQSKQKGFWSGIVFLTSGIATLTGLTFAVWDKVSIK